MPIKKTARTCKLCSGPVKGRSDKIFCTATCKAIYHSELKKITSSATAATDKILHRNRSTLFEIMGSNSKQVKVPRITLDRKKFNYSYYTGSHVNVKGKTYYHVYDFSWMIFTDQEVLIVRRKSGKS